VNLQEIQVLIADHAQEGPTLEFKAAASLGKTDGQRAELVKDITGLAHAAGGRVIYGVAQTDQDGISGAGALDPINDAAITGDWITQVVRSNTMPPLACFRCEEIPVPTGGRLIVVDVDQSSTAHQSLKDHRYWLRVAATTERMLDFQIRDVMNRRNAPMIEVYLGRTVQQRSNDEHLYKLQPSIKNIGARTLERWEFRLGIPTVAVNEPNGIASLGFSSLREGLYGIEYTWFITSYWPARSGRTFEVHPGQWLEIDGKMGCSPIPLRVVTEVWHCVDGRQLPWRIYSPDARPIEGKISYADWCDF
jgi:hypothetical protein